MPAADLSILMPPAVLSLLPPGPESPECGSVDAEPKSPVGLFKSARGPGPKRGGRCCEACAVAATQRGVEVRLKWTCDECVSPILGHPVLLIRAAVCPLEGGQILLRVPSWRRKTSTHSAGVKTDSPKPMQSSKSLSLPSTSALQTVSKDEWDVAHDSLTNEPHTLKKGMRCRQINSSVRCLSSGVRAVKIVQNSRDKRLNTRLRIHSWSPFSLIRQGCIWMSPCAC